jgi:hypothetical protein
MTTLDDLGLRGEKKDGLNWGELHHSVLFVFMLGIMFRDFLNFIYLFILFYYCFDAFILKLIIFKKSKNIFFLKKTLKNNYDYNIFNTKKTKREDGEFKIRVDRQKKSTVSCEGRVGEGGVCVDPRIFSAV